MTDAMPVYPEGYLIYLVKQVELGVRRPFEELIAAHGISTASYTALNVLQNRPGITSSELARRSFVRAQTMAETVNALIGAGFVRREHDPAHRRRIRLFITDSGAASIQTLAPEVGALQTRITEALDDAEQAELIRALRLCRDALVAMSRERAAASA